MQGIQEITVHGEAAQGAQAATERPGRLARLRLREVTRRPLIVFSCIPCVQIIISYFLRGMSCFSCFSWFLPLRSGLGALGCLAVDSDVLYSLHPDYYFLLFICVLMLFMLFIVFAFTERPGRLGVLSRGQRFPVFLHPDY